MLVGDAIIVGLSDDRGDNTDVPVPVRELLLRPATFRVEVRTIGDPKWYGNDARYDDYCEAIIWAMVLLERWSSAEDVRVVPVAPSAHQANRARDPLRMRRLPGPENARSRPGQSPPFLMAIPYRLKVSSRRPCVPHDRQSRRCH